MAFTENYTEFFNTDDFADVAVYTEDGGSPVNINGIFDDDYLLEDGGSVGFASSVPVFQCPTSNVSTAAPNDTLTVLGIDYNITQVRPGDRGITFLILQEV